MSCSDQRQALSPSNTFLPTSVAPKVLSSPSQFWHLPNTQAVFSCIDQLDTSDTNTIANANVNASPTIMSNTCQSVHPSSSPLHPPRSRTSPVPQSLVSFVFMHRICTIQPLSAARTYYPPTKCHVSLPAVTDIFPNQSYLRYIS